MDVSAELDRIFPVPLPETDLSKAQDELFIFLGTLSKEDYEAAITQIPDKPKLDFEDTDQTHGLYPFFEYEETTIKKIFWDNIGIYVIINYITHVSSTEIILHLLKRAKGAPGTGLRSLAGKLTSKARFYLFEQLLSLEDKDAKDRPSTLGMIEDYIELEFAGGRIGLVEYAIEELRDTYRNPDKKNKNSGNITGRLEQHILARIQLKRRKEFKTRLGKIDNVNKARFAAEEVRRELYLYPDLDAKHASNLSASIYYWYDASDARAKVRKSPSVLHYSAIFEDFHYISGSIQIGIREGLTDIPDFVKPHWDKVIGKFLPDETFWHSMQGLNKEIPLEQTEAGRMIHAYKMWAGAVGAIYVAVILLPFVVGAAVRAPGAAISAIRWAGGRLLLGTQHVYTTIKVFGLIGGGQRLVADVIHFYLRNPITINQVITNGTEIVLDLTGSGTGMTPGSSPNDLAAAATAKIGKMVKTGITKLADDALDAAQGAHADIHVVEMVVKGDDGNFYRVYASVKGGEPNVMKLNVDKFENLGKQVDADTQRKILFEGKPRNDNSIADARGTAAQADVDAKPVAAVADDVNVKQLGATGTDDGAAVIMGTRGKNPGKPVIGNTSSKGNGTTGTGARNIGSNGAGSMSRMSGATSKKPPPLVIDLAKPGAIQKLANSNPTMEEVINVLKDPRLFNIFKTSMKKSTPEGIQAANDMADLGGVLARFTLKMQNGVWRAETKISDAIWSLPGHARGILIEHVLSRTQYKDWHHTGQLINGFFPDIDWSLLKNGLDQRISLKTTDPFAKGYDDAIYDRLLVNLESLVQGTLNGRARGYRFTALLDVRLPLGNPTARADLLKTLNDMIPANVKQWVAALVDEF